MKRIFYGVVLLLLLPIRTSSQQQNQLPDRPPPYDPPRVAPEQNPGRQLPPDTAAPPPVSRSNFAVETGLQRSLGRDPALAGSNIKASVNDESIVLTGIANDERQHQAALQLAQASAGSRKIVDKIVVRSTT